MCQHSFNGIKFVKVNVNDEMILTMDGGELQRGVRGGASTNDHFYKTSFPLLYVRRAIHYLVFLKSS